MQIKLMFLFWKCHIDVRDGIGRMKPVENRTSLRCMFQLPIYSLCRNEIFYNGTEVQIFEQVLWFFFWNSPFHIQSKYVLIEVRYCSEFKFFSLSWIFSSTQFSLNIQTVKRCLSSDLTAVDSMISVARN